MRRLFLFLKAYQPGLFDEQVTVSGHATKTGKYVQAYQAKRKKRHDEPQAGDLFDEADRKEFQRKYPNFGTKYVVQPSGYPDGKLKVINDEGETERFGAPIGEIPRRFRTVEEGAAAMEKWLSNQKKEKPGASFAEAAAPKPKEPEKGTNKEPWQMTRAEWDKEREAVRPRGGQENFTRNSASQGIAQAARLQGLLYGVNDAASAKIKAAQKGELKLGKDEAEELLEQINEPVTHRRVIEKALAEGKPVPSEVLADYPELQPKEAEKPAPRDYGTPIANRMGAALKSGNLKSVIDIIASLSAQETEDALLRLGFTMISGKKADKLAYAQKELLAAAKARKDGYEMRPLKKSATITEPAAELIGEHRRLVRVLRSPSHADDLEEADEQEAELHEYERKAKRKKKLRKAFLVAQLHQLLKARANA